MLHVVLHRCMPLPLSLHRAVVSDVSISNDVMSFERTASLTSEFSHPAMASMLDSVRIVSVRRVLRLESKNTSLRRASHSKVDISKTK